MMKRQLSWSAIKTMAAAEGVSDEGLAALRDLHAAERQYRQRLLDRDSAIHEAWQTDNLPRYLVAAAAGLHETQARRIAVRHGLRVGRPVRARR